MANVRIAFQMLGGGEEAPSGFQQIEGQVVFDVKMENFRREARYIAGGHVTETPRTLTYASVVSREMVRIALTIAALNDLKVKVSDVQNAYLTVPASEKIWTVLGPDWGDDAGKKAIMVRALYGLKSAGASFRNHLDRSYEDVGTPIMSGSGTNKIPGLADPDISLVPCQHPPRRRE